MKTIVTRSVTAERIPTFLSRLSVLTLRGGLEIKASPHRRLQASPAQAPGAGVQGREAVQGRARRWGRGGEFGGGGQGVRGKRADMDFFSVEVGGNFSPLLTPLIGLAHE